jgi:hypothetical protein
LEDTAAERRGYNSAIAAVFARANLRYDRRDKERRFSTAD